MNILKRAWAWLTTKKVNTVTDATTAADSTAATTADATAATTTDAVVVSTSTDDAVLSQVKELLVSLGHDVEGVFPEVVALAKKIVSNTSA